MVEGAPEASRLNRLRQMWDEGRTALGVIATIPSVQVVQALAQTPLDFIVIDMEHGAIDAGAAHAMIVATSGTRLVPLVRIAASTGWHAKLPLDLGAMGICFPMTTQIQDAQTAARSVRYPPNGDRFWGPFYASMRYGLSIREYQDMADKEVLAIGTVEHIDSLATINEVVATRGLDLLFIGPGDLAASMGIGGRSDHPEVQAAMMALETAILGSSVHLGGVALSADRVSQMMARGYKALVVGFDWSLLQKGVVSVTGGALR
jgi:4-hydroxy-2-oxoheptanedioate aldolase